MERCTEVYGIWIWWRLLILSVCGLTSRSARIHRISDSGVCGSENDRMHFCQSPVSFSFWHSNLSISKDDCGLRTNGARLSQRSEIALKCPSLTILSLKNWEIFLKILGDENDRICNQNQIDRSIIIESDSRS
jgi:hypothetical protein